MDGKDGVVRKDGVGNSGGVSEVVKEKITEKGIK